MIDQRTNQEWLNELRAGSPSQEQAIADLRNILLRAALYSFNRYLGHFEGLGPEEILQRSEDCAQDALMAVLSHLHEFRGDSKFTTWAYKFAVNISLMAARRERWKGVSLDQLTRTGETVFSEWVMRDKAAEVSPEQSAMQDQLRETIRKVIQEELTEKQRQVLLWVVFYEVPMDEVVRHLGSNRNSVYKLLHDARQKLKSGLLSRGFEMDETFASFEVQG